jgi:hypothetical protein
LKTTEAMHDSLTTRTPPGDLPESESLQPDVAVPDHELLHPIGRGAYGEVWLAVNVMGAGRAVKIVRRESFTSDRPFEREFAAVKRYEPLSRSADGLVNVLHAGRAADDSVFYYVMELADADTGTEFDLSRAAEYRPRSLRAALDQTGGRLPLAECLSCAQSLTQAVASLHAAGLTHRDIKPSNIIFVHNRPKLADIGLVGEAGETRSFVGTEGYIPPEGPGLPAADIYALGMVCYVMATGSSCADFPRVPPEWLETTDTTAMEFMEIIVRATEASAARRYGSALEMLADITLMQSGGSVRRLRHLEHRWRRAKRIGLVAAATLAVAGAGMWFWQNERMREARLTAAETRTAEARAGEREQRFLALRERAAALLRSPTAGSRVETLKAIDEAAVLHPGDAALRDLLVTTLTRADFSPVRTWTHDDPYMPPAVSADGRFAALVEKDGGIRIEKAEDKTLVNRLPPWPGTKPWSRCRFTADGAYLGVDYNKSSRLEDARFRWWRVSDASVVWEGEAGVTSLGGVPARGHIITSYSPKINLLTQFDLDARRVVATRLLLNMGNDFVVSPDGLRAVFFEGGRDIVAGALIVDLETPRVLREVREHFMNRAVAWLPDSKRVIFGGAYLPFAAVVVPVDERNVERFIHHLHSGPIVDMAVSADGQFLLTGSWDQTTRLTHLACDVPLAMASGWGANGSLGFAADGRHCWRSVVQGGNESPLLTYCQFHGPAASITMIADDGKKFERPVFSPDGSLLVVGGHGLTIRHLESGKTVRVLEKEEIQSCVFVSDDGGGAVLCGCARGLFRVRCGSDGVWQPEPALAAGDFDEVVASGDGRQAIGFAMSGPGVVLQNGKVASWPSTTGVTSASLTADGSLAASVLAGANGIVLQNAEGVPKGKIPAPDKTRQHLSPDGTRIFLNEPEMLRCFDVAAAREAWSVPKDFPGIRVIPLPFDDGRLLLAKTGLHFALLDAATGASRCRLEPVFPFHGFNGAVSPDGSRLALVSINSVLLWDLAGLREELRRRGMEW